MKTNETKAAAVKVDGRLARLEITYKWRMDGQEYSDSNAFTEIVGGRDDFTESQARRLCVKAAAAWVGGMRGEGYDVSAFDDFGNCY